MNNYNYTIIIPHKNLPELLLRCLQSIPKREDVQIIIVDDNSIDADTYLERYPELSSSNVEIYFTKEGKGAGYARNVGLLHSQGEWVLFADSDDYFFPDQLNALFDLAPFINANVVIFGAETKTLDKKRHLDFEKNDDIIIPLVSFDKVLRKFEAWRKMVKRSFIEAHNLRFEEVAVSNDVRFHVQLMSFLSSEDIVQFQSNVYCWERRNGSITNTINRLNEYCRLDVAIRINHFSLKQGWGYLDNTSEYLWRVKQFSLFQFYKCFFKECFLLGGVKAVNDLAYAFSKDKEKLSFIMRCLYFVASKIRKCLFSLQPDRHG